MLGLCIGTTSCILIFLLISNELRFHTFHTRCNQIYRVVMETRSSSGIKYMLAAPPAWYFMSEWLDHFAYCIQFSWAVVAIGIISTLVIAIIAVGYRSAQAAVSNPAETLRME